MNQILAPTEFEHDSRPEFIEPDKWAVLEEHADEVRRLEIPLLTTLRDAYPQRFPRVCGPASIALAYLLNNRFDSPITSEWRASFSPPHLRLIPSWFNPSADPAWGNPDEHTYLEDHLGNDFSLSLDPTIRLQHGAPLAPGVTRIEWHESLYLAHDMTYMSNLYPPRNSGGENIPPLVAGQKSTMALYRDFSEIMHHPGIFGETVVTSQNNLHAIGEWWGPRLRGVIDHVLENYC